MEVEYKFLTCYLDADAPLGDFPFAQELNIGLPSVIGQWGLHELVAPDFPFHLPRKSRLVFQVKLGPSEWERTYRMAVQARHFHGPVLEEFDLGEISRGPSPGTNPKLDWFYFDQWVRLDWLEIPAPGAYELRIIIDGRAVSDVYFRVRAVTRDEWKLGAPSFGPWQQSRE